MPKRSDFPYHNSLGITFGQWYKNEKIPAPNRDLFRWEFKYGARQSVCREWLAWADWIVRYPNKVNFGSITYYNDWEMYAVIAGKHRSSPKLLLFKEEDHQWKTETIYLDDLDRIKDQDLLSYMRSFKSSPYRHYCENVATALGERYKLDISEKGDEMAVSVDTNEYKDPDSGGVITIHAGRNSISLTLKEAVEMLSEIPVAIDKYRTARRDSIADQIKELQSQLSLMDKPVPTQTSAPAISQPF